MSIMNDSYAEQYGCSFVEGGVASASGFSAIGIHAGFWEDPARLDMALVVADKTCAAAGVFTQNIFCAAPVSLCLEHLSETRSKDTATDKDKGNYGYARAVVINSGNANAATGQKGMETAQKTAQLLGDALGCSEKEILVASTGVIGVHLPLKPFETGIPSALEQMSQISAHDTTQAESSSASIGDSEALSHDGGTQNEGTQSEGTQNGGTQAALAIMTTDTYPKECAVTFSGDDIGYPGSTFVVGGMAKGAGMIMPDMATMLAVITTDAPIEAKDLSFALQEAVKVSFNKITVDSDTSTNDSCFLLASGEAAPSGQCFKRDSAAFSAFERALLQVCTALARAMVADGEGATRLVTVNVSGAASDEDADAAARSVANSPLTKVAIYGHDANWGRIAAALGRSGACFSQENVDIDIMGIPVCRSGLTVAFDEEEALERFEEPEIVIDVNLGEGDCETTIWTCDFSHEYVSINGDYRS